MKTTTVFKALTVISFLFVIIEATLLYMNLFAIIDNHWPTWRLIMSVVLIATWGWNGTRFYKMSKQWTE